MSASLSVSQVRQRFDRALTDAGFVRSTYVPELYGYDVDHLVPRSYSVGVGATEIRTYDDRAHVPVPDEGEGVTLIVIRTSSRIREDAAIQDYDAALDHEQALLKAALDVDATYLHCVPVGISRQVTDTAEWLVSTITIRVWHRFALSTGG